MKYKLTRQTTTPELNKIISREVKLQNLDVPAAPKKLLKQLAEVGRLIEKEGIPNYLVVKKLKGMGHGVFLHPNAKPIQEGQVIASYSGVVTLFPQYESDDSGYAFSPITDIRLSKEEQRLFDPKRRYHPRRLYAIDLDAVKQGNFTRFINHSEKPNVGAEMLRVPKNPYGLEPSLVEIIYIAHKTIQPGEQLLVCYEDEVKSYWSAMGIKPVPVTPQTFKLNSALKIVNK